MPPLHLLELPTDALLTLLSFFTLRARFRTLSLVCKRLAALVPISIRRLPARPLAALCRLRPALLAQCVNLRELGVFCESTDPEAVHPKCQPSVGPLLHLLATRLHSLRITQMGTGCETETGALASFAPLTSLRLEYTRVVPAVTSLVALNSGTLTRLSLADVRPMDYNNCRTLYTSLPPLPALRKFALTSPVAPTAPLLARLSSLTKLNLEFFATDIASLHAIALPHLTALTFWQNPSLSVASCAAWLRSLPALRSLKLYCIASDASLLAVIASLTCLVTLSIEDCADCRAHRCCRTQSSARSALTRTTRTAS